MKRLRLLVASAGKTKRKKMAEIAEIRRGEKINKKENIQVNDRVRRVYADFHTHKEFDQGIGACFISFLFFLFSIYVLTEFIFQASCFSIASSSSRFW